MQFTRTQGEQIALRDTSKLPLKEYLQELHCGLGSFVREIVQVVPPMLRSVIEPTFADRRGSLSWDLIDKKN